MRYMQQAASIHCSHPYGIVLPRVRFVPLQDLPYVTMLLKLPLFFLLLVGIVCTWTNIYVGFNCKKQQHTATATPTTTNKRNAQNESEEEKATRWSERKKMYHSHIQIGAYLLCKDNAMMTIKHRLLSTGSCFYGCTVRIHMHHQYTYYIYIIYNIPMYNL